MVFFDSVFAFQRTKVVRHSNDKARTPSRGARSELESIAGKNSYCRKPATLPLETSTPASASEPKPVEVIPKTPWQCSLPQVDGNPSGTAKVLPCST